MTEVKTCPGCSRDLPLEAFLAERGPEHRMVEKDACAPCRRRAAAARKGRAI